MDFSVVGRRLKRAAGFALLAVAFAPQVAAAQARTLECEIATREFSTIAGSEAAASSESVVRRYEVDPAARTVGAIDPTGRVPPRSHAIAVLDETQLVFCESLDPCGVANRSGAGDAAWTQVNLMTVIDLGAGRLVRALQTLGHGSDSRIQTTSTIVREGQCRPL